MSSHLHTAFQRIQRSPYQTLAAVSIMTMTLFLASVFFLLAAGSQLVLRYFETRPQVNAFFKAEMTPKPQDIDLIKAQLDSTGLIESFKYVSKEDALRIYKDLNKSDPLLLEAVTSNMLPASIEVSAKDPKDLKVIADLLKNQTLLINDVRFEEDIVSTLSQWTRSVRTIGISLVGTHVFITFTIILLIIGVKIANRRDEISVLSLVGATSGYISAPFILEGILYGVFGGFIAWGISYLLILYSTGFLISFLSGIPVSILPPPIIFMLELLVGEMLLGAAIGGLGGLIAVRRFLKA